jgi:hypothetical protein
MMKSKKFVLNEKCVLVTLLLTPFTIRTDTGGLEYCIGCGVESVCLLIIG